MNKNTFWLITLLFAFSFGFFSCSEETHEVDPFADWAGSNELYLDSIVRVARNCPAGEKWKIYRNFKKDPVLPEGSIVSPIASNRYDSVYVKILEEGNGIVPLSSDTVSVAYQGFLVNGERFDGTYTGEFDRDIVSNFVKFGVGDRLITGWTTAMIHMKEKTFAEIYIPYQLAYGEGGKSSIPGYSVLKFELYIDEVIHPKGPDDRSRTMKLKQSSVK